MDEKLTEASATGLPCAAAGRPEKSWTVCPGTIVLGSSGPLISRRIASGELSRTAPAAGSDESTVGPSPGEAQVGRGDRQLIAPGRPVEPAAGDHGREVEFPAPLMATK